MRHRRDEAPRAKSREQGRPCGPEVRSLEPWEKRGGGTGRCEEGRGRVVGRSERRSRVVAVVVVGEAVVDEGDRGAPHEEENALDVEFHAEEIETLGVGHESVETANRGQYP